MPKDSNIESTLRELEDHSPQAQFEVGVSFSEEGEYERSVHSFKRAIELDPEFADAYLQMGEVLNKKIRAQGKIIPKNERRNKVLCSLRN